MTTALLALTAVLGGFLVGSIPFGVVVSRVAYRRDIRTAGSGNIGAANALRTLGKTGGAAVLLLDGLKGALPVLAVHLLGGSTALGALAGGAAVAGHCFSPFLGWRGGKGVATSYGVMWALAWPAAVAFTLVWIAAVIATGYASLGSMLASAAMAFALWFVLGATGLWYGVASAVFIAVMHRANIARLRAGTENPLRVRQAEPPTQRVRTRRARFIRRAQREIVARVPLLKLLTR